MNLSRRQVLAAGGLAGLAVSIGVFGRVRAASAEWNTTTLQRTLVRRPTQTGFADVVFGDGEPHLLRTELASGTATYKRPLIAFAQMSDLHVVDDQSPLRVEFLDRYALTFPPYIGSYPTESSYRPHEMFSTHLVDAMCRAIARITEAPATGLPLAFTIVTGDAVDNCQYNETRWYIDILDGRTIRADSGTIGLEESVSGTRLELDPFYWHPGVKATEDAAGRPDFYFRAGYPNVPDVLPAARRPFTAHGLGMPWYTAYGNHDGLIQGNVPPDTPWLGGALRSLATGGAKAMYSSDPLPLEFDGLSEAFDFIDAIKGLDYTPVTADLSRRILNRGQFIAEHFNTTTLPAGHGFSPGSNKAYYEIPAALDDPFRFIVLDSTRTDLEGFGPRGGLDDEQFEWLAGKLKAYSSHYVALNIVPDVNGIPHIDENQPYLHFHHDVEDKLVVLFCHHTLDTMTNSFDLPFSGHHISGAILQGELLNYPNVILMVNGHKHSNNIWAHARDPRTGIPGGFWEVNTASHIDWPNQSRLVEVAEGVDSGTLSIFTTMVDADAPLAAGTDLSSAEQLAAFARQVAANDPAMGFDSRRGDPNERNAELLLPTPFPLVRWGARVAAATGSDGRIRLLASRPDDAVVHQHQMAKNATTDWSGWASLDGSIRAAAAAADSAGRIQFAGLDRQGRLFTRGQAATGVWTPWAGLDGTLTSVAMSRNPDGRLEIFGTDREQRVSFRAQTAPGATTWGAWTQIDGAMTRVASTTRGAGRVVLFGVGVDGRTWYCEQVTRTMFGAWATLDTAAGTLTGITAAGHTDGRLEVFGTTPAGRVVRRWETSAGGSWSSWETFDESSEETRFRHLAAATNADGRLEVFGINGDAYVYHRWQVGTDWSSWLPYPALVPQPTPMPYLYDLSRSQATAALVDADLALGTVEIQIVHDKAQDQKVTYQSIAPGVQVSRGTVIYLSLGRWDGNNF